MSTGESPASPASPTRGRPPRSAGATALAVGTAVATVASYLFTLVLSRSFGPVDFGAIGALLGVAVVAGVPASALQLVVARAVARAGGDFALGWVRPTVVTGSALALVGVALAPLVTAALRLPSSGAALWLAALAVPQLLLGGQQGVLLGRGRLARLAVAFAVAAGARLAAGVLAAELRLDLVGVMAAVVVASVLVVLVVAPLLRAGTAHRSVRRVGTRTLVVETLGVSWGIAGLLALLNLDVLLARAFLDDRDAGLYAFVVIYGRVTFWGTYFLALQGYARWAAQHERRSSTTVALVGTALLGAVAVLVTATTGAALTRLLVGESYVEVSGWAPWFAVAGTLLALVQIALFADVARGGRGTTLAVWGAVLALLLVVVLGPHEQIADLVRAVVLVLVVLTAASLAHLLRRPSAPADPVVPAPGAAW